MKKTTNKKGFTLVELLVVVAIIGILASIAIPQFAAYRERAHNGAANSDLRTVMTSQETYFVDFEEYANTKALLVAAVPYNTSSNVEHVTAAPSSGADYQVSTCSTKGSDRIFRYRLSDGLGIDTVDGTACSATPGLR